MPLSLKNASSLGVGSRAGTKLKPGNRALSAQLDRASTYNGAIDVRSVQTRAASLDAAMERHAQQSGELPSSAEDLFAPFMRSSKNLPEWAQRYMNLLAESTTTQGSMQKHLVKLLAKGAADLNKTAQIVADPMDGITDVLADHGSRFILTNMDKVEWRIGGLACPSFKRRDGQSSESGSPARPAPPPEPDQQPAETTGGEVDQGSDTQRSDSTSNWKKIRMAVKSTAMFKGNLGRAKDDSCLPDQGGAINPVHSKALSLLLSMMMSGATSGVSYAMPSPADLMPFHQNTVEVTQQVQQVQASPEVRAFKAAASFARAPSLAASFRAVDCSDSIIGISGMAASTAMKLLRSDSKSNEGVAQVFGAILETVSEADERDRRSRMG